MVVVVVVLVVVTIGSGPALDALHPATRRTAAIHRAVVRPDMPP
jgi:hypothetical protein